jgi:hypothetical protein
MPAMVDRPATTSALVTVASGQVFSTSLIPTAVGNATKVFDVDSSLTDTAISGGYVDEIWFRYSKLSNLYLDARAATTGTYAQAGTAVTVTSAGHNVQVGQPIYLAYTSGTGVSETLTVTGVTATTFTGVSATTTTTSGNVNIYLPLDACFYLVSTGSITNINQFFPLFVASIPATADNQTFSLTLNEVLPLINHPVVQAGTNFKSTNSKVSPKIRGLMLQRGQALYVSFSGTTSLSNGFYVGVQAGYY